MGILDLADEQNLTQLLEEVTEAVKADMEEIKNLLLDLPDLNKETKSKFFELKPELVMENQERHKALKDLQTDVFLSIAVLVEKQSERMDDIELNVAGAGAYTNGGTNALF
ncbi:hypothetical protein L3X38_026279 [Prunus dulcis]|uniref:t-SNARE coiled-coil homology domain-containing protein n=2 Tax=Prunus dulcis TaxID=3755 RepID=A0AAD4YIV2_PRUDU|nr:hypothetical protein L3X38_026279 [Prunus dulcis]